MIIKAFPNEHELLLRVSEGNETAFKLLFENYHRSLATYVFKVTESLEITEEIVQDVFVKVWLKREELGKIKSFKDYIFILCRNQAFNALRQITTRTSRFIPLNDEIMHISSDDDHVSLDKEIQELIDQAFESLPSQQKKIYLMGRVDKIKYKDIANQLNISPDTVKKHMYLASKTIKDYVQRRLGEAVLLLVFFIFFK